MLVVFGITGDLAKVMTFRSLYRLEQRGPARLPDRRRRGRRLDRRRPARARARRRSRPAARRSTRRSSSASPRGCPTSQGDFADPATFERVAAAIDGRAAAGLLPRDPAVPVRHGGQGPGRRGPDRERARRGREAVRPRPRVGARARRRDPPVHRRVAAVPDRPLPREDGPRRDPLPAVRERDASSRSGTATTSRACRSRWPRTSASRTAATSTTRSARCATSSSTT